MPTHHRGRVEDDEAGSILNTSLTLLGLDPKQHRDYAEVAIGPGAFKKANPRALELALYHLFTRTTGKDAAKKVHFSRFPATSVSSVPPVSALLLGFPNGTKDS